MIKVQTRDVTDEAFGSKVITIQDGNGHEVEVTIGMTDFGNMASIEISANNKVVHEETGLNN